MPPNHRVDQPKEDVGEGDFCWYPTGYRRVLLSDTANRLARRGKYRLSAPESAGRNGGFAALEAPERKIRHIFRGEFVLSTAKAVRRT